jgi:hypothetical protein
MGHDEFKFHHPHSHEIATPSVEVPTWALWLMEQVALLRRDLFNMKQSTQDLVDAFGVLAEKVNELEAAADALKGAQTDGSDEVAVKALTQQLLDKATEVSGHLPTVAAAVPPVVAAPADPSPVPDLAPPPSA